MLVVCLVQKGASDYDIFCALFYLIAKVFEVLLRVEVVSRQMSFFLRDTIELQNRTMFPCKVFRNCRLPCAWETSYDVAELELLAS